MLALSLTVEPGGLTVDGAIEKIRAARAAGDNAVATVTVKGVNALRKSVVFTPADHDIRFVGGVWANNLWYDARGKEKAQFDTLGWDAWVASGKETGSAYADPGFADAGRFDFTLKPDSPALKLGFKPFDYSKAGSSLNK